MKYSNLHEVCAEYEALCERIRCPIEAMSFNDIVPARQRGVLPYASTVLEGLIHKRRKLERFIRMLVSQTSLDAWQMWCMHHIKGITYGNIAKHFDYPSSRAGSQKVARMSKSVAEQADALLKAWDMYTQEA